ncbi:MAG: hypothetical protein HUK22_07535, partial [Thermoguttaceae bacterium]|nr:hypothetical protein [Thermoguttaceae bacterium]
MIYADKMYYDVKNRVGVIQDAELVAKIPEVHNGVLRVGAKEILQTGPNAIKASDAWFSTSEMGSPSYGLHANTLRLERNSAPLFDAAGNAADGQKLSLEDAYVVAENNYVTLGPVPVFYWPWMAMEVKDRSMYLRSFKYSNDSIFGTQFRTAWNPFQLFGISDKRPEGVEWDLNLDYLSRRGFGHGTTLVYQRDSLFGGGRAVGMANYYGVADKGKDNFGLGRRALDPEKKYRYRAILKHRQELGTLGGIGSGWFLTGQFGKSSDRNFIPQFFEEEWRTSSNPETSLELKRLNENASLNISAAVRTDNFYTQTNWLPRLDHYWLGQPLGETISWYEHTKLGYAQFRAGNGPNSDAEKELFRHLAWELDPSSTSSLAGDPG